LALSGRPRTAGLNSIGIATAVLSLSVAAGAHAGSGGVEPGEAPEVTDVRCRSDCAGLRKAAAGSKVELIGRRLGDTVEVSFNREGGGRVRVAAINPAGRSVKARVPEQAATGKPRAIDSTDGKYPSPEELRIVDPSEIPDDGDFKMRSIAASPRHVYLYGLRRATAKFTFRGTKTDIVIEVVNRVTGKLVRRLVRRNREPFVEHRVAWNGRRGNGDRAPQGKYRFRVGPKSSGQTKSSNDARFDLHGHIFPVRARHSYGDGIGAGRGHQGQDVFASCGSTLVAARGGKVQWKRYHSAAGYYLVIDGWGTGRDYMYAHMAKRGRPNEGTTVKTGERIGRVSDTGNASGCHLHFELWSAPGWYEGGHPTNPTDDLKAWDRYS